jgi:hypothetical protein
LLKPITLVFAAGTARLSNVAAMKHHLCLV